MTTTPPTPQQILDLPMEENDSGADTVCGYLIALLAVIWDDGQDLSPFGNSGWEWDLYQALVTAGYAENPFDDNGCIIPGNNFDKQAANALIASAIEALDGGAAIEQAPQDGLGERLRRIAGQADEISKMAQLAAENAALREQGAAWKATVDNQQRTIELLSNMVNAMNMTAREAASDPNGPERAMHGQLMQTLGITDPSVPWAEMLAQVHEVNACASREQQRYQELAAAVGVDPATAPWGSASWDALIERVNKLYRGAP